MNYREAVREFEEFFQEIYNEEVEKFSENRKDELAVSFEEIDLFNPYLADYVRENGDQAMGAAKDALINQKGKNLADTVWFNDFPEHERILPAYVSSEKDEHYLAMQIKVKEASDMNSIADSVVFMCIRCGDLYGKEQDNSSKLETPNKCDCGSKDFEVQEKMMTDHQEIKPLTGYKDLDIEVYGDARPPTELERHEIVLYGVLRTRVESKKKSGYLMEGHKLEIID